MKLLCIHEGNFMPSKRRLTMRHIRHIRQMLRLSAGGTSVREIAVVLGIARSTVQDNLDRAKAAGLSWPLPGELTDDALEHRLFIRAGVKQGQRRRHEPNWAELAIELKKPGVTLLILWEEYRGAHPDGYGYSRFCELFRGFEQRLSPTMRQEHAAGDKVFVDYSGKRVPIVDRKTGEIREAELFLGVLGASSYTFAEATWTQTLPDWVGSHVRMFAFFGGVPRLVVPDNLKSGVSRASFYDPEINRSYGMMASHYGVGVLPARPRRPKELTNPTIDMLRELGLTGMASAYQELETQTEARHLERGEWLALLLEREATTRRQKRFEARARAAKLRHDAQIENADFRAARGLDRNLFMKLAGCDWISQRHSLLLIGPAGVGKSWLACALGNKACREDFSVAYHRLPRLFATLALSRGDGRYPKVLKAIDHRHQSGARRSLVRHDRQSNHRRCDPRPPRAQRLPHRTFRRELAKAASNTIRRWPRDNHEPFKTTTQRHTDCPASNRNRVRHEIGIPVRLQIGIAVRHHRNTHPRQERRFTEK